MSFVPPNSSREPVSPRPVSNTPPPRPFGKNARNKTNAAKSSRAASSAAPTGKQASANPPSVTPASAADALTEQLDLLDQEFAQHGERLPNPHYPLRIFGIICCWLGLSVIAATIALPPLAMALCFGLVPVLFLPEVGILMISALFKALNNDHPARIPILPPGTYRRRQLQTQKILELDRSLRAHNRR